MTGIFSITSDHINRISDEDCVELFGELLHADARRLKIPIPKISFTWETRADAGVDATVEGGISEEGDIIIDSETFYQIKSGLTFKPQEPAVINGLERIVFERELFTRGGVLLRSLAEAENEDFSNNATGLFAGLFSLGHGYVSLTKASPTTRIRLLKETLCSENESRRNLGLKACESALQSMHFIRPSGLSGDELRLDQKGWAPKTYGEWGGMHIKKLST